MAKRDLYPWTVAAFEAFFSAKNRQAHAYLLAGHSGLGKTKFAEQAASDRQKTPNQNANYNSYTTGWEKNFASTSYNQAVDPLEAEFQKWELDDELERMKRNMGKG